MPTRRPARSVRVVHVALAAEHPEDAVGVVEIRGEGERLLCVYSNSIRNGYATKCSLAESLFSNKRHCSPSAELLMKTLKIDLFSNRMHKSLYLLMDTLQTTKSPSFGRTSARLSKRLMPFTSQSMRGSSTWFTATYISPFANNIVFSFVNRNGH